jgi:predicted nucleic acid-binding protein
MTNRGAWSAFELLRKRPEITLLDEPSGTAELWARLAARDTASPKVWMDAYLAAFAIRAEIPLLTLDQDFLAYRAQGLQFVSD